MAKRYRTPTSQAHIKTVATEVVAQTLAEIRAPMLDGGVFHPANGFTAGPGFIVDDTPIVDAFDNIDVDDDPLHAPDVADDEPATVTEVATTLDEKRIDEVRARICRQHGWNLETCREIFDGQTILTDAYWAYLQTL